MLIFVYLKSFVKNGVSLPVYVNVPNFCFIWCFSGCVLGRGRDSGGVSERGCCVLLNPFNFVL